MKTTKKLIKPIAFLLGLLILLQSCVAYKSTSVSLEEAVKLEKKAKIETKGYEILKFQKIVSEEGKYYGVKKIKGEKVKILIDSTGIKKVMLHDKTLSTVLTIALPIGIILGSALIFQDAFKWKNSDKTIF